MVQSNDSKQQHTVKTTFESDTSGPVHTGSGDINYTFISRRNTPIPSGFQSQDQVVTPFLTPALPPQGIYGRSRLIKKIIANLHLDDPDAVDVPPLALRGMAGIGKTTLITAVGRLQQIQAQFPDGVLWTSVGQTPTIRLLLDSWGRALGIDLNTERDERACQLRLVRPAITTMEELVADARQWAEVKTIEILVNPLPTRVQKSLDTLLVHSEEHGKSPVLWLRRFATGHSDKDILEALKKLTFIRQWSVTNWEVDELPPSRLKYLAQVARYTSTQGLKRKKPVAKRHAILVAFLLWAHEKTATNLTRDTLVPLKIT